MYQPGTSLFINVKDPTYGAKGDGYYISGVNISAGSNTFSYSGFTTADIGKLIYIDGAGPSGGTLSTTISGVSGSIVTLAANASVTVNNAAAGYASDGYTAISNAIAAAAAAHGGTIYFPAGIYGTSQTLTITTSAVKIVGTGSGITNSAVGNMPVSEIRFFGTGDAVFFDGGASGQSGTLYACGFQDMAISGTSLCTNALRLRNCHHGTFKNYRVRDCTNAGTKTEFAISNVFESPRCSTNETTFLSGARPSWGMYLSTRNAGEATTSSKITVPIFEGIQNGIWDDGGNSNNVEGGTCEGVDGYGIKVGGINSVWSGMDLESNVTGDILVLPSVFGNTFIGMQANSAVSAGGIHFQGNCYLNSVVGGEFYNITIDSATTGISISGTPAVINKVNDYSTTTVGTWYSNTQNWGPTKTSNGGLVVPGGGIQVGVGTGKINAVYQGSFTWSAIGTIPIGGYNNNVMNITGVQLGDCVNVVPTTYPGFAGFLLYAFVDSANTILFNIYNISGVSQTWPANMTFNFYVWR